MSVTSTLRGILYESACRHLHLRRLLFRGMYAAQTAGRHNWTPVRIRCTDSATLAAEIPPACVVKSVRNAITLPATTLLQSPQDLPPLESVYHLPRLYRTVFRNATVFAGGVVLTPDARLPKDLCPDLGTPSDWHRVCELRRLPLAEHIEGDLTVLSSFGNAFYHWVMDSLPRLGILAEPTTGKVLIENHASFEREYLSIAGIPAERILSPTEWSHYAPDRLIVPSLPGCSGCPPPETVQFLRQLRDRVWGTSSATKRHRRLYATRSAIGQRSVANEEAVRACLARYDFQPVDAGTLSVKEQMAAFTEAEIVVGAHGGALANLVYCAPGTPVIELMPASYINPCFRLLCWSAGLVYGCLVCPCVTNRLGTSAACARNFTVPLHQLDDLVARGLRRIAP